MRTQYQNPMVQKAFKALERLSADEETRQLAEMRERALINEKLEVAAARREGSEEKQSEIVKKMLLKGFEYEMIAEITGINFSEIDEIKKQITH